jgi:hypothetical protein
MQAERLREIDCSERLKKLEASTQRTNKMPIWVVWPNCTPADTLL